MKETNRIDQIKEKIPGSNDSRKRQEKGKIVKLGPVKPNGLNERISIYLVLLLFLFHLFSLISFVCLMCFV